jgi:hypothetical protein
MAAPLVDLVAMLRCRGFVALLAHPTVLELPGACSAIRVVSPR